MIFLRPVRHSYTWRGRNFTGTRFARFLTIQTSKFAIELRTLLLAHNQKSLATLGSERHSHPQPGTKPCALTYRTAVRMGRMVVTRYVFESCPAEREFLQ